MDLKCIGTWAELGNSPESLFQNIENYESYCVKNHVEQPYYQYEVEYTKLHEGKLRMMYYQYEFDQKMILVHQVFRCKKGYVWKILSPKNKVGPQNLCTKHVFPKQDAITTLEIRD